MKWRWKRLKIVLDFYFPSLIISYSSEMNFWNYMNVLSIGKMSLIPNGKGNDRNFNAAVQTEYIL